MSATAIWWIRRDLRLTDNPALHAALKGGRSVIPLFILDDRLLYSPNAAPQRIAFMLNGLKALDVDLKARGSMLIVRTGRPEQIVPHVVRESGASEVYAIEDVSLFSQKRDMAVAQNAPLRLLPGLTIYPPDLIHKSDGTPYIVFTPFSKAWKRLMPPSQTDLLPAPDYIPTPNNLPSEPIDNTLQQTTQFLPGETEAQRRLTAFTTGDEAAIWKYANDRNQLDLDGISKLSPYLHFGMLSARQTAVCALEAIAAAPSPDSREGANGWLNELIWREFYNSILYHFPHVSRRSFRPRYETIPWNNSLTEMAAWRSGQTGFPIIDAAMRQLLETGWMHNRARMITASFLVKDLLIDWRWGEQWFMQNLVDGDMAANNGGWQWTAGTGTDAAPYFRIFNPTTQAKRFDPGGRYIRHWLPELALVPDRYIHEPHKMPTAVQLQANCHIGQAYPAPIINHKVARKRALAAYKSTKENS